MLAVLHCSLGYSMCVYLCVAYVFLSEFVCLNTNSWETIGGMENVPSSAFEVCLSTFQNLPGL